MTELHIKYTNPFEDDLFNEKSLRPFKLEDFIGQNELVDSLSLYIKAAKKIFLLKKRLNQELTQKNNPKLVIENYIKNNQEF